MFDTPGLAEAMVREMSKAVNVPGGALFRAILVVPHLTLTPAAHDAYACSGILQ